jgi:iron complex outermembrane receptor protein
MPGVASAQQPEVPPSEAGRQGLEEVIVTAQRREQALQDVPIALQVVGVDLIADVAAENMGDLDGFVPGLVVSSDSPTQPRYAIRGIQTGDFGVGTDPAVGVYVDGIYAARSGASLLAFNDIERIEVLKGPQGTLFGRNSAAGAISIVTRQPADEFDALLRLRVGDYGKQRVEGMLNAPLADGVAVRINALYNESDGWVEDAATGQDLWPEENWSVRAALRWDIAPGTKATLTWDHDEVDQLARPAIGIVPLDYEVPAVPYPPDPDTFLDPREAPVFNDVVGNKESRSLDGLNLVIDHAFDWADFRSTTAWRQFDTVNREDEDGTNFLNREFAGGTRYIPAYFDTANIEDNKSWYQEFKFSGTTDRLDWVGGVSYYDEHAKQASDTHTYTDSVDTLGINLGVYEENDIVFEDGTPFPLYTLTSAVLAGFGIPLTMLGLPWREAMYNDGEYTAAAVFGDVIWHVNDRLNLTFGLRYTHDAKEFSWFNGSHETPELDAVVDELVAIGFFPPPPPPENAWPIPPEAYRLGDLIFRVDTPDGPVELDDSWDDVSPRLVVDYAVSPDVMVFGSLAKGYKAGGYNSVEVGSQFDNEDVWNVEAGVKSVYPHVGVILNASTFYYVYYDKQAISLADDVGCSPEDPDGGGACIPQYVVDTSDEKAWGIDAEARWQPYDHIMLYANVAFIDATYKDKVTRDDVDLSGEPTGEPYLSAALGASYVWMLDAFGDLDLSARYAYRGESRCNSDSQRQGTCQVSPNFDVGEEQHRLDVRLAWTSEDDGWGLAAFVTNVLDDQYVTGVNNLTNASFGTPFASISEPRQWGLEAFVGF